MAEKRRLVFRHHVSESNAFGDKYWHLHMDVMIVPLERYSRRAQYLGHSDKASEFERFGRNLTKLMAGSGGDEYVSWMRTSDCLEFKWQSGGQADMPKHDWYAMQFKMDCNGYEWETLDAVRKIAKRADVSLHERLHPQDFARMLMNAGALPLRRIDFEQYDHEYFVDKRFDVADAFPYPAKPEPEVEPVAASEHVDVLV